MKHSVAATDVDVAAVQCRHMLFDKNVPQTRETDKRQEKY